MAGFSDQVAAVDAAVRDHLTDPAHWRVAGVAPGAPAPVLLQEPDVTLAFGESRAAAASTLIKVFKVDVAAPARDDVAAMDGDGRLFKVIGRPMLDAEGSMWTCEAVLVAP